MANDGGGGSEPVGGSTAPAAGDLAEISPRSASSAPTAAQAALQAAAAASNSAPIVIPHPHQAHPTAPASNPLTLEQMVRIKIAADAGTLYPNHGFARGGIGTLLATGSARGGISRLPHAQKAPRGTTTVRSLSAGSATSLSRPSSVQAASRPSLNTTGSHFSTTITPGSTAAATQAVQPDEQGGSRTARTSAWGSDAAPSPQRPDPVTAKEWEKKVPHPCNFQSATRRSRPHDVHPASRWAGISYYETDPSEIKRHLDIVNALDQLHAASKAAEIAQDSARRSAWASRQRVTFRRQRQELALKYQALGLPPRPSYSWATSSFDTPLQRSPTSNSLEGPLSGGPDSNTSSSGGGGSSSGPDQDTSRPTTVGPMAGSLAAELPRPAHTFSRPWTAGVAGYMQDGSVLRSAAGKGIRPSSVQTTLSSSAGMLEGPRAISLPKPTFVKVFDRMSAELRDSPRLKEAEWRAAKEATRFARFKAEVEEEVQDLERFEDHLNDLARQKARSQYSILAM